MPSRLSPATWFALVMLLAALMLSFVIVTAMRQPALGLTLGWDGTAQGARVLASHGPAAAIPEGTVLRGITDGSDALVFQADDFAAEPASALPTLTAYDVLLQRQERMSRMQAAPSLFLLDANGRRWQVNPGPARGFFALPVAFWVQVVVGLFAWLIASGVWIFRRNEPSARYLLLNGFSTLVFAPFAAVYSTRELALPETTFRWLCDLNFMGGCLYIATMLGLLWYYPRRLGRFPFGPVVIALFGLWWLAQELRLIDSMLHGRRTLVLLGVLATVALGMVQWRGTRTDPVARAALKWFLLAWLVGASLFAALIFVPQMFGVRTDHLQGYAFLLFLLVYGGLAFGILRFRLFDLGEWWFRILLWVIGAITLVTMDLALLLLLNLGSAISLSLALLVCGFLWLPLRGWLWTRLVEKKRPGKEELFRRVLDISLAVTPAERQRHWRALLVSLFDPLQVEPLAAVPAQPELRADGLHLAMPAQSPGMALLLGYPEGGRRLFTPRDLTLAADLLDMLRHADASRDAYNQGAREERSRIARDLHDDIGARLLAGLHQADIADTRQTIQQAITEMRAIINGLTGTGMLLDSAIAELRYETSLRLEAAGIALDWPLADDMEGVLLDYRTYRHYMSMLREIISNIVRHSGAGTVQVRLRREGDRFITEVVDDGRGLCEDAAGSGGHGLANLVQRARALHGTLALQGGGNGTHVRIELPLESAATLASGSTP